MARTVAPRFSMLPATISVVAFAVMTPWAMGDAPVVPEGYHRIATDSGKGGTSRPHLQMGHGGWFGDGQIPADKLDSKDPARSILYEPGAVVFDYRGLNPQARYALRLTFLSDHPSGSRFPQRVVAVKADRQVLAERVALPKHEILVEQYTLPEEVYADGAFTLRIEKLEGHNAVVSQVELWSDRNEPLPDVRLPAIFASHMVLQRERPIPVWGFAEPGRDVTVKLAGQEVVAKADERGRWEVRISALPAGGPYQMRITGERTLVLNDILIGDVWICSGQSNMEMPLRQDKYFAAEKAELTNPKLRLLRVPALWSMGPAAQMVGNWSTCDEISAPDFSAAGYYFGKEISQELDVPVGLIQAAIGGTPIDNWTPGPTGHWYNGMLHPILPFAIRGAIWYQGESNIESGENYLRQMQELIGGWRRVWGQGQFPVYFVQIAPYRHRDDATLLPIIWQAQLKSLQIPNTGMAVTTDVGEQDLHPPDKRVVGHRLALWALANTYDRKQLAYSGPIYSHFLIRGNKVEIYFRHAEGGLTTRDGKPVDWFEIAGKDGQFVPATATIEGDRIVVTSEKVAEPVAVRFGWNQLAEPNLVNRAGLPASPFRTE